MYLHICSYVRTSVACAVAPGGGGGGGGAPKYASAPPQPINSHHATAAMQLLLYPCKTSSVERTRVSSASRIYSAWDTLVKFSVLSGCFAHLSMRHLWGVVGMWERNPD